jgi:hypothetical protein
MNDWGQFEESGDYFRNDMITSDSETYIGGKQDHGQIFRLGKDLYVRH